MLHMFSCIAVISIGGGGGAGTEMFFQDCNVIEVF